MHQLEIKSNRTERKKPTVCILFIRYSFRVETNQAGSQEREFTNHWPTEKNRSKQHNRSVSVCVSHARHECQLTMKTYSHRTNFVIYHWTGWGTSCDGMAMVSGCMCSSARGSVRLPAHVYECQYGIREWSAACVCARVCGGSSK